MGKALSYGIAHDNARRIALLQQTERMIEAGGVSEEGIYKAAQADAVLGDKAAALRVLRKSVEGGFFCSPYFRKDPLLDSLRQEPAFSNLTQQAETRHQQFKTRFFPDTTNQR